MSRFFDVIVLAFLFASLALPVSLQAQHHGGFHRGPTATITVRPPAAGRGPEFVGTPVAPFVNSPVTPFIGGVVTPLLGRPAATPEIGRASCGGRGEISVGAGSFKKKKKKVR